MERDSGTRSGLLWEVERLLKETKELPDVLIMENVPQVLKANGWYEWCEFLENLGYNNYAEVINAKRFGIPQNRERCFMVSILGDYSYNFPKGFELKYRLKDLLEENVDEKYYLSDKMLNCFLNPSESGKKYGRTQQFLNNLNKEVGATITTLAGQRATDNYLIENEEYDYSKKDGKTMKQKLCDDLIKNGVVKENDVINHSYTNGLNGKNPNSRQKLEDYIETTDNSSPCLTTRPDTLGVVVKDEINIIGNYNPSGHDVSRIVHPDGIVPTVKENHGTVTAIAQTSNYIQWKEKGRLDVDCRAYFENGVAPTTTPKSKVLSNGLRIRKLSPRECWRLMGVKDTDYNKITCSNAQKYKQAGNSIVTTCLMAIYSQLYKDCDYKSKIDDLLKELTTSNDDNKQINK